MTMYRLCEPASESSRKPGMNGCIACLQDGFSEYAQNCSSAGKSPVGGRVRERHFGNSPIRITVLDSETRSVSIGGSDVPKNCDQVNFDAYCNNSQVRDTDQYPAGAGRQRASLPHRCTIDSKIFQVYSAGQGRNFRRQKRETRTYRVLRR